MQPRGTTFAVGLVTSRQEIGAISRDALSDLPGVEWTLLEKPARGDISATNLIVWDLQPEDPMPDLDNLPPACHNIFLVHESCLERACRRLPIAAAANLLVEPAESAEIREFLSRAFRRVLDDTRCLDPRKKDRDDLLQALLLAGLKLSGFRDERVHFFRRALRDMASPLTALSGYCGLLLDQQLGPLSEVQLDVLRQMQSSAERLSNLLSSTLHLSRGVLDPSEVRLQPGDITALLDTVISQVMPGAEAREIEIRTDAGEPEQTLRFDPILMQKVLFCLLNNACRFSSSRGTVEIRGYAVSIGPDVQDGQGERTSRGPGGNDGYRIDIRDFGAPIPPESLASVFDLAAASSGGSDRSEGGLELAMCKMIVQAHKGELSVESGESGTVFSVILPCSNRSFAQTAIRS